jgi:hypothetical protein
MRRLRIAVAAMAMGGLIAAGGVAWAGQGNGNHYGRDCQPEHGSTSTTTTFFLPGDSLPA